MKRYEPVFKERLGHADQRDLGYRSSDQGPASTRQMLRDEGSAFTVAVVEKLHGVQGVVLTALELLGATPMKTPPQDGDSRR